MATTQGGGSSCLPSSPFMNLGDGANAPILNYNLPQKTCYNVNAFYPLSIPKEYFAPEFINPPAGNPWDVAAGMTLDDITTTLRSDILGRTPTVLLQNAAYLLKRKDLIKFLTDTGIKYLVQDPKPETYVVGDSTLRVSPVPPPNTGANGAGNQKSGPIRINHLTAIPSFPADKIQVAGYTLAYIADQVANGLIPEMVKQFGGRIVMKFRAKPVARPIVTIVEHLKLCSFLGDYGAGKTVKTFSLLPGERTTIAVRSYKDKTSSFVKSSSTNTNEYTSTYFAEDESSYAQNSENVLDSYSQHSADQLQELISEMSSTSLSLESQSQNEQITEFGGGANLGINLGIFNLNLGGGAQASNGHSSTANAIRDTYNETLNNSMQAHVSETGQYRDIEVNTTTGNSSNQGSGGNSGSSVNTSVSQQESMMIKAGEETTTLRELQNINYSRVLNFVFRQMLQEYITLTYLHDATIQFSTGFHGHNRVVRLSELEGFLEEIIPDVTHRDEVRKIILLHFCNVTNYQGTVMPFAEKVTEVYQDCVDATSIPAIVYWRKKKNLLDTYTSGGLEISVPGVITSAKSYILKTDSVIVDALLGQGEALDCYNMRLQDSAALAAEQRNDRYSLETRQEDDKIAKALEVISAITDPIAQADAYKKIFGQCCSADELSLILNPQAPA